MVGVAQLVELLVVVQVVAGSSPVTHPKVRSEAGCPATNPARVSPGAMTLSRRRTRPGLSRTRDAARRPRPAVGRHAAGRLASRVAGWPDEAPARRSGVR